MCDLSYLPKTSSDWAAWAQAVGTILAVGAAIIVAFYESWAERRRKRERLMGMWAAVQSEVERCGKIADDFIEKRTEVTPYRFTAMVYDKILPELLIEARLNAQDSQDLLSVFSNLETINAGFDKTQEMDKLRQQAGIEKQASFNLHCMDENVRTGSAGYKAAMAVIERHMA